MSVTLNNVQTMDRSMDDMAYDYLGQLLLQREADALLREIEEERAAGLTGEMDAFFARLEKKHFQTIERFFRRRNTKRFWTKTLPGIGRAAAAVLAVMVAASGVAMAVSETFRVHVLELVADWQLDRVQYEFKENHEVSFDVPVEWVGSHYPSWIPEGFEISDLVSYPGFGCVTLTNPAAGGEQGETYADFSISEGNTSIVEFSLDDAEVSKTTVRGHEADLIRKPDSLYLLWTDGEYFFQISTRNMSYEDTFRFAEGIALIPGR